MAEDKGGPAIDQGGAPEPFEEDRDRDRAGITGNAAVKGEQPAPGDCAAIDLDSARDRAS